MNLVHEKAGLITIEKSETEQFVTVTLGDSFKNISVAMKRKCKKCFLIFIIDEVKNSAANILLLLQVGVLVTY